MKFLFVEILVWLIAASVLGLIIGWLFKSLFARNRLSKVTEEWSNRYAELKTVSTKEISTLEERVSSMQSDNSTLQSKVGSLSAMVKSTETALLKANSENKALTTTVSSQKLTIDEIRVESEGESDRTTNESNRSNKSDSDSSTSESDRIASDSSSIKDSKKSSSDSIVTPISPAKTGVVPILSPADTGDNDIDAKIKNLNAQRDKLKEERKELFNKEQHFASQLTRGDDTEAYLDQTIRIDDDLTTTMQADATDLDPDDSLLGNSTSETDEFDLTHAHNVDDIPETEKPKTLWDKFKASVNKSPTKPEA